MNGNITREGIRLDLEWMHRVGLGGFQNFDAALQTPRVVDHRIAYMTPEWKGTFFYATKLADQLGLEETIASSPGWSETGGPWVPPSHGMKKYVWSETIISGGRHFQGALPNPPANTGTFQGLGRDTATPEPEGAAPIPEYYADSVVIAYRQPSGYTELHPTVTSSAGSLPSEKLADGDLQTTVDLPGALPDATAWVQYDFKSEQTIRALTLAVQSDADLTAIEAVPPRRRLETSKDGQSFQKALELPTGGAVEHTVSFPPITAKYFRVVFEPMPTAPDLAWTGNLNPSWFGIQTTPIPKNYRIAELVLHPDSRVNRFEEKAGFATLPDLYSFPTPGSRREDAVPATDVIDLTSNVQPDGTLDWTIPPGEWHILRFGYSLTGKTNHPATAEATGLEVDKLDGSYVKDYFERYLDTYKSAVGAEWMGKRGVKYVVTDSWESRTQNWTDHMLIQFKKRRGYDPLPWMPVLTGRIVESSEASDRFLWDFRKTIADLTADEHYGQIEASLKVRGMGHYGESHEGGRAFIADGMEVKKLDDIPMSAMWLQRPGFNDDLFGPNADIRESASVAHIYGQNLVAAESMTAATAHWAWSPATLKPTADKEMAEGINLFVIHCSTHQPLVGRAPGLALGGYGQWFNRNDTWAEQAGPWVDYLSRSSYLLQQGNFAADILYFYGEDSNVTAIFDKKAPDVPPGFGYDYVNADALLHMFRIDDGRIVTASGMSYRVLALDAYSSHMSLPVLRKIRELIRSGATVVGAKPVGTPSLADNIVEFNAIANELWGAGSETRHIGKGTLYGNTTLGNSLADMGIEPDFTYATLDPDTGARIVEQRPGKLIDYVHRSLPGADLYYLDNRQDREASFSASFRVHGRRPELWHADTGKTEPVAYSIAAGRTTIPLRFEAWGTVFVVFRTPATQDKLEMAMPTETRLETVDGPWHVSFQPGRGAPLSSTFDQLASWPESADSGVKYFSGTGTYEKKIDAPANWFKPGSSLWLDLGDVRNLATVTVNGKLLGTLWHAPYRLDITSALKPGKNVLKIGVTNAWVNRLIGDRQENAPKTYTFTVIQPYSADSPLLPSGLLGPVSILSKTEKR